MESSETIDSSISAVKSISDTDFGDLLEFSQKESNEDVDLLTFQNNQAMDSTDLFQDDCENELLAANANKKYPQEFDLSFSARTSDSSLVLSFPKTDTIELSCDNLKNNLEESAFVLPQIKDEPLDLSVPSIQFSATIASKIESDDNLDIEFSSNTFEEDDIYQIGPSCSRRSPMDFLAVNYSQTSLEDERPNPSNQVELPSPINVQRDLSLIPNSVHRLYETIKLAYSDFAFVYSLSAQMCQERVPMDCFVHLKIGLLLSIASLEDNRDRPPISIVAIGPEFGMANYLMENIGNVAERFVGPDDDFKIPSNNNATHTWIEADPIVMAKGGIYYAGEWGRLSATRSFKLFKTIECGRVSLEKTTVTCELDAAIWTHWRSYKYDTKDQHTFTKFLEIFGIPIVIEDDNHEVLVDFMLEQASIKTFESTIDELSIGTDEMRNFLSIVSKRRVDISDEASEILRKYFVASRMDRPDCLTQKSFSTLKLFAESFAKLSLRHDVIVIDAIAAIYMTENLIQHVFGPGAYPPPKFQTHTFIGAVDEHMKLFHEWVLRYISQFLE